MKQWNNPRPDVVINSIDMTYGADKRGVCRCYCAITLLLPAK
jgi:hypothetical protein